MADNIEVGLYSRLCVECLKENHDRTVVACIHCVTKTIVAERIDARVHILRLAVAICDGNYEYKSAGELRKLLEETHKVTRGGILRERG